MTPLERLRYAREISALGPVPPEVGHEVLDEFNRLSDAGSVGRGGADSAQRLVTQAMGPAAAESRLGPHT